MSTYLNIAVLTVSDTRTSENDTSGQLLVTVSAMPIISWQTEPGQG